MAKAIFNVLFEVISGIAAVILLPINTAINVFMPDVSRIINTLTTAINVLISNGLNWGFNILPPNAQQFLMFYLAFLVSFYTISYTIHGIVWLIKVIKKLPLS